MNFDFTKLQEKYKDLDQKDIDLLEKYCNNTEFHEKINNIYKTKRKLMIKSLFILLYRFYFC